MDYSSSFEVWQKLWQQKSLAKDIIGKKIGEYT